MRRTRTLVIWSAVSVSVIFVLFMGDRGFFRPDRLKYDSVIRAQRFYADRQLYDRLLENWTEIQPVKCGKPTANPGFVNFEAITREQNGTFSLRTNEADYSRISMRELTSRLEARPEVVRSELETLTLVGSPEIIQSGGAVHILSAENDTRGYLHIDVSCAGAVNYAFWSKQPGNFTVENPGHYVGLKSLGSGWYYYIEQR